IASWDNTEPKGTGQLSQADDHMVGIKRAINKTFPAVVGIVTASHEELNGMLGYATGGDNVETRLVAQEGITSGVTNAQLLTLLGIDETDTIQNQINDLLTWIGSVTSAELHGMDNYVLNNGVVEDRLNVLAAAIQSIEGGGGDDLSNLTSRVVALEQWANARDAAANDDQLVAIKTYLGFVTDGAPYVGNDLGADMLTIINKIATLESISGTGNTGGLMFKTELTAARYLRINNVVNAPLDGDPTTVPVNTRSFGFVADGCTPNSPIDFRFEEDAGWGGWVSAVSPAHQPYCNANGRADVSLVLCTPGDSLGEGGGRLPLTGNGQVQVRVKRRLDDTDVDHYRAVAYVSV
ncbi:MAG: hypothetical protein DRI65_14375, partial [Chloroflexota bacterium]